MTEPRRVSLTSAACASLMLAALAAYFTCNFVHAQMQMRVNAVSIERDIAQKKLEAISGAYTTITGKETVLYEETPAGMDVLHGLGRIEAGHAADGTVLAPRVPRWVIPFAVRPTAVNGVAGAAYAYRDKQTGEISQVQLAPVIGGSR